MGKLSKGLSKLVERYFFLTFCENILTNGFMLVDVGYGRGEYVAVVDMCRGCGGYVVVAVDMWWWW